MVRSWEPGTDYERGDVVKYHGHRFKAIQKHSSLGDWTPGVTPALWGMLEDDDDDDGRRNEDYRQHESVHVPEYQRPQYQNDQAPYESQHQAASQYQNIPQQQNPNPPQYQNDQGFVQQDKPPQQQEEEKKPGWFSEHKKELEVGGAIATALGLAGVGYGLMKHHEKSVEEKQAHNWARDNWEKDAQIRTDQYRNGVQHGPATWILTHGKDIPHDAIVVGQEHDWTLYICRAYHEGGKQIGKASQAFQKGAVIGYLHHEVHLDVYEVLVGNPNGLRWEPVTGRLNLQALRYQPVEGGNENDGTPLYIVKAPYKGFTHPGKTSEKLDGAYIPYDGTEKCIKVS